ncbi:MAG: hypothetical protein HY543_11045 [Deltaproteobacteria bacterium]|nr:hypothetical protein [Deltaproteobacteria bacterium]
MCYDAPLDEPGGRADEFIPGMGAHMPVTFNGITISGGISPVSGTIPYGKASGRKCELTKDASVGLSIDPFSFEIPSECAPQPGDTIKISASTLLLIDRTTVRYNLCGGECRGEFTETGFSLGLEIKKLTWKVL